jgi:transposase-like protein
MGQVLHGSAATTHAIRGAIQRSQASIAELSRRYGVNPKTVAKWRKRASVDDAPMGPRERRSSVLSKEEEALVVTSAAIRFCHSMTASTRSRRRSRI